MLARANRLKANSLCVMTMDFLSSSPYFLEHFGLGDESKERATDAVCQFDFLQCMISAKASSELERSYPSFGAYFKTRVEPLVTDLLTNGPSRTVLEPIENEEVAKLVASLDAYANKQFPMGGWDGREWTSETMQLIRQYAPQGELYPLTGGWA
jgi:hypothetical protein